MISAATDDLRAHAGSVPRTTATGTPRSFPMTSSAAEAISSAMHSSVATSSRPLASRLPRRSTHGGNAVATDRHVDDAASPRSSEGVGDDHRNLNACECSQPVAKPPRGTVGVHGEECGMAFGHVRQVDSRVRTDESRGVSRR